MKSHRGLIVAHSVGSGKTLTAVTASQCFLDDHPSGIVKIVTPVSLQSNMKKEMKAAGVDPSDPRYEFYTLHGFSSAHALSSVSSSMTRCGSNTMLIIDEAHELRTDIQVAKRKIVKKSKGKPAGTVPIGIVRADIAVKCAKDAAKVLLLTGTAVYNSPRDMANLVAMVRGEPVLGEKAFERMMASDAAFKKYFSCITSFYENPKDENFPTVKERYVEFEMTPKYYKEYKAVENRTSSLFNAKNPSRFLIGFRQASNALTECIKCEWVLQKAKEGKKMVIFSSFITFGLEKIQEKFKAAKIPFVEVKGSMSKEEREKAVNKYNTDKVNILFITKAGGQGLDLKGTRYFILFEKSWNDATEEQAKGRAARYRSHTHLPKSEQTVEIFHLMMVKPRGNKDRLQSADSILKSLILQKNKEKREFLKRLFPLSIEQMAC
jgi:superfamily II DNA or RNA helicase